MPLKDYVCPVDGCWRSFRTEEGAERHVERSHRGEDP